MSRKTNPVTKSRVEGKSIIYAHVDTKVAKRIKALSEDRHQALSYLVEKFLQFGMDNIEKSLEK